MRRAREILRQKLALGRSHREVMASLSVSMGTVSSVVSRAQARQLDWSSAQLLTDDALEELLYGKRALPGATRPVPDWAVLHTERRRPGVTLELLHLEYLERYSDGYRYSQFCELYRQWLGKRGLVMRQEHHAGEKLFIDYAGQKPHYTDPQTGERVDVELFVAVLGASNLTYAEATASQRGPDFIASHVRAFSYMGGVARALVPDQLRTGVSTANRYEPEIQRTYEELALHYGTTILPARPASPRDKAKVEVAVQIAERWILARLRNRTFFSLDELNQAIAELLEELNTRPMRVYRASRRELFDRIERAQLLPLPPEPFVYASWKLVRVHIDYHVEYEGHYYSVPYTLVGEQLDARATATTVELFRRGVRVAAHQRSYERGRHTTVMEHMPKAHQKHAEWSPQRITSWAATVGPMTAKLVEAILADRPHPEQGYRSCLGIFRLGKRYGQERLEAACARAYAVGARSYRHVDSILRNGLDRVAEGEQAPEAALPPHVNIRGRDYYH
jgi:transposase